MSVGDLTERDDRPAYVRFERRAVESKRLSLENGRSTSVDKDFVLVTPPYSKDLVEMKVATWLDNTKKNVKVGRTPKAHLEHWEKMYEAFKNGQEAPLNGSPIKEWSAISPAQIKNLIAINILTIEDLAAVNDQGLARIGMGGQELRRKAVNWLKSAVDHGEVTLRLTQLETDNERLMLANESLVEKNQILNTQLDALRRPVEAAPVQTADISVSDIMPDEPVISKAITIGHMPETSKESITDYTDATRDQLIGAHIQKFGKAPHHLSKDDTIRNKLTA